MATVLLKAFHFYRDRIEMHLMHHHGAYAKQAKDSFEVVADSSSKLWVNVSL